MAQKNPQIEIAQIFAKVFNQSVLLTLKEFWENNHKNLSVNLIKKYKKFSPKISLTYPVN
jgi:hypothetical protein